MFLIGKTCALFKLCHVRLHFRNRSRSLCDLFRRSRKSRLKPHYIFTCFWRVVWDTAIILKVPYFKGHNWPMWHSWLLLFNVITLSAIGMKCHIYIVARLEIIVPVFLNTIELQYSNAKLIYSWLECSNALYTFSNYSAINRKVTRGRCKRPNFWHFLATYRTFRLAPLFRKTLNKVDC